MSRNYDWSPLGFYSDPVPGEPTVLTAQVKKYKDIAENIQSAATGLQSIVNNYSALGDFVEAFTEQADEVIGRIRKAKKKYTGFANAVESYIGPLTDARQESYDLLIHARTAHADLEEAESKLYYWRNEKWDADPADLPMIEKKIDKWEAAETTARNHLQSYGQSVYVVIGDLHAAAQRAADAIEETGDASGINDSGWVQFWEANGGWIDGVLNVLSIVAAVALVICLCIPGLNVLVGALLLIGTIIAMAMALNSVLQATAGTKSVTDAIIDVALALIPFGIGKLLRPAAKLAQAGANAAKPALMASSAAQGIRGVTAAKAATDVAEIVANAKPAWWMKALLGSADELAQIQAIKNITIGPSTLINAALKGQMWKLGLEGSPVVDVFINAGGGDLLKEGVNNLVESTPFADSNHVHQPDSW